VRADQFQVLLTAITSDLTNRISRIKNLDGTDAILAVYASKLYADLEKEETKLWQYSTEALYALFEQEQSTGRVEYPEP